MPRDTEQLLPLSRREITALLQSLATEPDAFFATATALYGWCNPADIDDAVAVAALPIPRCLHGNPWNKCHACGTSVRGCAATN